MNNWQRWLLAPHTHWLRKTLFQIHLWLGIGVGFYVLVVSISGSAILLKSSFYQMFEPRTLEPTQAVPLEDDALDARIAQVYPGYEVTFMIPAYEPNQATYVVLKKDEQIFPHYFNQYTGEDIGVSNPWPIKAVEWLADVHDDLLQGNTGRKVNGLGALIFLLMSFSGIFIWWQGQARWYEGLILKRSGSRSIIWQLHSVIGFWSLLLLFAWGVSGFQLGFPQVVDSMIDWFDTDLTDFERPNSWLSFFRTIHFARLGEGAWVRWGWIFVSFLPTFIFVSGFYIWWQRVVLKWFRSRATVKTSAEVVS